jgi:hypothetical protein
MSKHIKATDRISFDDRAIGKHQHRGMYTGGCTGKEFIDLVEKTYEDYNGYIRKERVRVRALQDLLICLVDKHPEITKTILDEYIKDVELTDTRNYPFKVGVAEGI